MEAHATPSNKADITKIALEAVEEGYRFRVDLDDLLSNILILSDVNLGEAKEKLISAVKSRESKANLRADLDDLISRIATLSGIDIENAKRRLIGKIVKEKAYEATASFERIAVGIEPSGDAGERPVKAASSDLSTVLHSANFEDLLGFLRTSHTGASTLSPKRFSEALSIDIQILAKQAHVHRNTISRAPESESVQRFLRESLRVLRAAMDVSQNMGYAIFWYRNDPLSVFGYKTAEQMVTEGRTEDLLRYIESLEAGVAG